MLVYLLHPNDRLTMSILDLYVAPYFLPQKSIHTVVLEGSQMIIKGLKGGLYVDGGKKLSM